MKFLSALLPRGESFLCRHPQSYGLISLIWLGFLAVVAFLAPLGTLGVTDKTESLFVEVAHQMYVSGDWITPRWNGEIFFDYPVWGYWLVALSFKVWGVSEAAARLPGALAAIAVVIVGFWVLKDWGLGRGEETLREPQRWLRAWLGAGILALNPAWLAWGRTAVTDMFLASAITLTLLSFFLGYVQPEQPNRQRLFYYFTPVSAAIAVLAKGPVGVLLPGLVILCFLVYRGELRQILREVNLGIILILFLLVVSPWYRLATQAHGLEFINSFFGFSNFQRFTSVLYRHAGPWWFYLPWCLILLLPWSPFLPLAIAQVEVWRWRDWRKAPRSQQLGPFCCFWLVLILLFFSSAATKLPGYILPLIPAAAILLALFWGQIWTSPQLTRLQSWPFLISAGLNGLILLALAIAAAISPQLIGTDPAHPALVENLQGLHLPLILASIISLNTLLFAVLAFNSHGRGWLWLPNLGFWLGALLWVLPPLGQLMDSQMQKPFRELSRTVGQVAEPQEPIWVMGYRRYSLVFYSQKPAIFLDDVQYGWELLQRPHNGHSSPTVLITGDRAVIERFNLQPQDYQMLGQWGNYQLLRVAKSVLLLRKSQAL